MVVQSERFGLLDCIKYDKGILDDPNTHDIYDARSSSRDVLTRTSEYTSLTEKVSGTDARVSVSSLPSSCTIELDYCCVDGAVNSSELNFYYNNGYKTYASLSNLGYTASIIGEWVKLKITYGNGSITMTSLDDPTKTITKSYDGDINAAIMVTSGTVTEVRWKNLKIYPI